MATSIEQTVSDWVSHRSKWEQELFGIASKGSKTLTADELDSVYTAFKNEKNLLAKEASPTENETPTDAVTVAAEPVETEPVEEKTPTEQTLVGLTHEEGVNVLEPGSKLVFGKNLTVVFGRNGSGKSGFCRILKNLCSSIDMPDKILGDVSKPAADQPPMRVSIHTETSENASTPKELILGVTPKPDYLKQYSYYETGMAVLIDRDRNLAYRPPLLAQLNLVRDYIGQIESELSSEISQRRQGVWRPKTIEHTNDITKAISKIGEADQWKKILNWSKVGDPEKAELKTLESQLSLLRSPKDLKKLRASKVTSLTNLEKVVTSAFELISSDAETAATILRNQREEFLEEAKQLEGINFENEPIQPIPSEQWIEMIKAALSFNETVEGDDGLLIKGEKNLCPLCMQVVGDEAESRLTQFLSYVTSEAQKNADVIKSTLAVRKKNISALSLNDFSTDSSLRQAISEHYPELAGQAHSFFNNAKDRKRQLLGEQVVVDTNLLGEEYDLIVSTIQKLLKAEKTEPGQSDEDAFTQKLQSLKDTKDFLEDRIYLSKNLENFVEAKAVDEWISLANAANGFLSWKREYSNFIRDTEEKIVGEEYLRIYRDLASELGVNVVYEPGFRGSEGQLLTKLVGGDPSHKTSVKPTDVLSEGERRILSLIHTLVNFQLDSSAIGLIMDDPVCSVDREYMIRIASTLCTIALKKQVIIFTHDTLFCHYLWKAAETVGAKLKPNAVSRTPLAEYAGCTRTGIFPNSDREEKCLGRAKIALNQAINDNLEGEILRDKLIEGFSLLRAGYENLIQSKLLGGVVKRWEEPISFLKLPKVCMVPELYLKCETTCKHLSGYIDAHFKSPVSGGLSPTIHDLRSEIRRMEKIQQEIANGPKVKNLEVQVPEATIETAT